MSFATRLRREEPAGNTAVMLLGGAGLLVAGLLVRFSTAVQALLDRHTQFGPNEVAALSWCLLVAGLLSIATSFVSTTIEQRRIRFDADGFAIELRRRRFRYAWDAVEAAEIKDDFLLLTVETAVERDARTLNAVVDQYALSTYRQPLPDWLPVWSPGAPRIVLCKLSSLTSASAPMIEALQQHTGKPIPPA